MRRVILISIFGAILAGCGSVAPVIEDHTPRMPPPSVQDPQYILYSDQKPKPGKPALLFFAKDGDPFSTKTDEAIREVYGASGATITTYRLDSTHETGAMLTYIVFFEDTVVLLGQDGARKGSLLHPSKDAIKTLLTRGKLPQ